MIRKIEELPDFRIHFWPAFRPGHHGTASVIRREDGECIATLAGRNYLDFLQIDMTSNRQGSNAFVHQLITFG